MVVNYESLICLKLYEEPKSMKKLGVHDNFVNNSILNTLPDIVDEEVSVLRSLMSMLLSITNI